jgi:hypothetical protein
MRVISRKARMGAPLTIGPVVVFQRFGVDVYNSDVYDGTKVLKKSVDFVGYDVDGEYMSANYSATVLREHLSGDYLFKGKENFEIVFEDTDDVSFL